MGTRPPYPAEYRAEIVRQVRAGRTPEELACEHEPTAQTIRNWLGQADRDQGRRDEGPTSGDREELTRLRRENKRLREERAILAKAAAWFGQETGLTP
jgi:transposase